MGTKYRKFGHEKIACATSVHGEGLSQIGLATRGLAAVHPTTCGFAAVPVRSRARHVPYTLARHFDLDLARLAFKWLGWMMPSTSYNDIVCSTHSDRLESGQ